MAADRFFRLLFTAEDQSGKGFDSFRTRLKSVRDELAAARGALLAYAGAQIGASSIQALVQAADEYQDLSARVQQFTRDGVEAVAAQKAIYDTAQQASIPLKASVDLYQALHARVLELGGGLNETATIANVLGTAIDKSATSVADADTLITGFSKSLAAGEFNGRTFNALLAATPQLVEILARQLRLTTAQFKDMGDQGKLSGREVLNALIAVRGEVDALAGAPDSVGEAAQKLGNAFAKGLGEVDESIGATDLLAKGLTATAENISVALNGVKTVLLAGVIYAVKQAVLVGVPFTAQLIQQTLLSRTLTLEHVSRQRALIAETAATVADLRAQIKLAESYIAIAGASQAAAASERLLLPLRAQLTVATERQRAAQAGLNSTLGFGKKGLLSFGTAFNLLAAGMIGWEIGTYLKNEFAIVEKAGIALASGIQQALTRLQYRFKVLRDFATGGSNREALLKEEEDQLAEIRDGYGALFDNAGVKDKPPVLPAAVPLTGELPSTNSANEKAEAAARKAADARQKLLKAQQDATINLAKAENDRVKALLDARLQDEKISYQDYYAEKLRLAQGEIDREIAGREAQLRAADADDRVRLAGEIAVLRTQRLAAAEGIARDEAQVRKKASEEFQSLQQQLLTATGHETEARLAALQIQFDKLIARLKLNADDAGVALAQRLFNVEQAKIQLDEIQTAIDAAQTRQRLGEQRIGIERETGLLTERESRRKIIALHLQTADELEKLIPLYAEQAATIGDPASIARLEELKLAIVELRDTTDASFKELADSIGSSFSSELQGILNGTQSFGGALKGIFRGITASIAKGIADDLGQVITNMLKQLAQASSGGGGGNALIKLAGAAFSFGGGSGSAGSGFNLGTGSGSVAGNLGTFSALPTFHSGGMVTGARGQRSLPALAFAGAPRFHDGGFAGLKADEVPSILQRGEEVLTARDPRHQRNGGGVGATVNVTIVASDPNSFRSNQQEIAATLGGALQRAQQRNR